MHAFVEVLVVVFNPLFNDTACYLLVVIVERYHFAAFLRDAHVYVSNK